MGGVVGWGSAGWWSRLVRCDCPLLLSVLEVGSDLSFHPLALILIGSARRKLTCTICNRKCSSSLNLQEHRKVSLYSPNTHSDLGGFTQLTQFCMIPFYRTEMSLLGRVFPYCGIRHTLSQPILLIRLYDQVVTNIFRVLSFSQAHPTALVKFKRLGWQTRRF